VHRAADKAGTTDETLLPDTGKPVFEDSGAVSDPATFFYRVCGLSSCTQLEGP
jgi:hypothetical protein